MGGTTEPASISTAIKIEASLGLKPDIVRCTRCDRPLTARKSLERGLGPVCCQAVAA